MCEILSLPCVWPLYEDKAEQQFKDKQDERLIAYSKSGFVNVSSVILTSITVYWIGRHKLTWTRIYQANRFYYKLRNWFMQWFWFKEVFSEEHIVGSASLLSLWKWLNVDIWLFLPFLFYYFTMNLTLLSGFIFPEYRSNNITWWKLCCGRNWGVRNVM